MIVFTENEVELVAGGPVPAGEAREIQLNLLASLQSEGMPNRGFRKSVRGPRPASGLADDATGGRVRG